ncbi:arsenate reductase family protein [Clostridium ihumii]|uniref:arsenate reductase family protein n=1 Tax=Clostridium ihumii TaxID=1470356 RepID=UPI00058C6445|nr:arsenate reductase family protein [Clostridium ihumii]
MKNLFLEYPKCTTCKKAYKFLVENNIEFEDRHIVEFNPSTDELKGWIEKSSMPINKFFNTSGILYREMNLKDKVKNGDFEELIEILASNGMLVKRPILILEDKVLIGFKEEQWREALKL